MSNLKTQIHTSNVKSSDIKDRAYQFSLAVIKFTSKFPQKRIYWIIGDQLLRSSTSIGANIVEAKSSSSKREFIKFYEISLKSANETKYWLCLLRDGNIIEKSVVKNLLA
jgi:four helix bundle protein